MREVTLTQGQIALVDDNDFELVSQWKWCASADGCGGFYAKRAKSGPYMHRVILDAPKGTQVDHIDGDGLNNQRANIRFATPADNAHNMTRAKDNTTGYKGVVRTASNKWQARIRANGIFHYLGTFVSKIDAALAYNNAAQQYFGKFAWLNHIPDTDN